MYVDIINLWSKNKLVQILTIDGGGGASFQNINIWSLSRYLHILRIQNLDPVPLHVVLIRSRFGFVDGSDRVNFIRIRNSGVCDITIFPVPAVRMMKNSPDAPVTAAIGDGGNDVAMIQVTNYVLLNKRKLSVRVKEKVRLLQTFKYITSIIKQ